MFPSSHLALYLSLILSSVETVEDLTVTEEVSVRPPDSRSTPLKSLLKKPSFEMAEPSSSSDCSEAEEGKVSPPSPGPKKVHFSEIDQVRGQVCIKQALNSS